MSRKRRKVPKKHQPYSWGALAAPEQSLWRRQRYEHSILRLARAILLPHRQMLPKVRKRISYSDMEKALARGLGLSVRAFRAKVRKRARDARLVGHQGMPSWYFRPDDKQGELIRWKDWSRGVP